jgi:hypothetical protein
MVEKYVGTSYDILKKIYDNLEFLEKDVGRQDFIMDQLFYRYTATGNQTAFNGVDTTGRLMAVPGSSPIVYINRIRQDSNKYTVSEDGTSVTFNSGVAADAIVQISSFAFNEDGTMYHSGVLSNTDLIQFELDINALYDATVLLEAATTNKASEASTDRSAVAADLVLTNADTVATAADVTSTNADVVTTNADATSTAQDAIDTAANLAATNQDTLDTAADLVLTNADAVKTAQDVIDTAASESAAASSVMEASTSESNAATSEANAAASFTSFNDRYLGGKAGDPTVDNDGDPLVEGTLYFNETDKAMFVYEGSLFVAAYASLSGAALSANNGSDFPNKATVRTNIGLGTAATTSAADYATAAQGDTADSALQSSDIGAAVQAFDAVLDATTASFLTAEKSKLTDIETSADVTDATNVTAAGALMDSEVTNLAQVKAFSAADYATAEQGTLADNAATLPSLHAISLSF